MATSFQKKARVKIGQIPGTRPSLYNKQLLISTGIPSLDNVIGGGLGVGTVLMIEEDTYGNYARLMVKYFAAEAVMTGQSLLMTSIDEDPQQLMKELPSPVETNARLPSNSSVSGRASGGPLSDQKMDVDNSKMKIAWRYEQKPVLESTPASNISFGHYYDLTKTMEEARTSKADISYSHPSALHSSSHQCQSPIQNMNPNYCRLLQDIRTRIEDGGFATDCNTKDRKILRIGIHSMGSPLWGENGGLRTNNTKDYDPSLALFLLALRSMLRSALAVAVVTIPTHLWQEESHVSRLHAMCDTVVRLESFAGSDKEKNPIFKEYHGLLHLVQLPRVNSLVPAQPETSDLAFKLRRKKFTIEKLHLPPDLSDTTSRSQEDSPAARVVLAKKSSGGCGTSASSKLDF